MRARYFVTLIFQFLIAPLFSISAYAGPIIPKCQEKIQDFLAIQFGGDFKKDENIKIVNVIGTRLVMVIDKTPTINPSRHFLLTDASGGRPCLVLTAPIANEVYFSKSLVDGAPTNIITRSAGQGSGEISIGYKWSSSIKSYRRVRCALNFRESKPDACRHILSQFGL